MLVAVKVVAANTVKFCISMPSIDVGTTAVPFRKALSVSLPARPLARSPVWNVCSWLPLGALNSSEASKTSSPVEPFRLSEPNVKSIAAQSGHEQLAAVSPSSQIGVCVSPAQTQAVSAQGSVPATHAPAVVSQVSIPSQNRPLSQSASSVHAATSHVPASSLQVSPSAHGSPEETHSFVSVSQLSSPVQNRPSSSQSASVKQPTQAELASSHTAPAASAAAHGFVPSWQTPSASQDSAPLQNTPSSQSASAEQRS